MKIFNDRKTGLGQPSGSSTSGGAKTRSFDEILSQKASFEVPSSLIGRKLEWGSGPSARIRGGMDPKNVAALPDSVIGKDGLPASLKPEPHIPSTGRKMGSSSRSSGRLKTYSHLIEKYARKHGVDPNLVAGVIKQESNYNPRAVSRVGAKGLMQLMPGTAKKLGVRDPFDPEQCIDGGTRYLRQQLDKFGSVELALAAYNAGPGNVSKYGNHVPPFAETRHYVRAVARHAENIRIAGAFPMFATRSSLV